MASTEERNLERVKADLAAERDQLRIAQQQRDWATGWAQRLATALGGLVHGGVSEEAARRELTNAEAAGIEAIADLLGPAPSSSPALPTSTETERQRLAGLLHEAIREYADHQSWRCAHPDRYPLDEVDPPDCPCGLHRFTQRVEAALAAPSDRDERGQGVRAELVDALSAIAHYTELGVIDNHRRYGEACGEDACIVCLIHETAVKALQMNTASPDLRSGEEEEGERSYSALLEIEQTAENCPPAENGPALTYIAQVARHALGRGPLPPDPSSERDLAVEALERIANDNDHPSWKYAKAIAREALSQIREEQ